MRRYGLGDDQWERIRDMLPGREGHVGVTAQDNRLFVEAVLYRFRAGIPWRDLPERFGDCLQALGSGCRQRLCDDRQHHRARPSAQCRREKKSAKTRPSDDPGVG